MKNYSFLVLCFFNLIIVQETSACRGPFAETTTFLEKLPKNALEKDVVAKVEVLSNKVEKISTKLGKKVIEADSKIIANVKVIEALKGIEKGSVIKIIIDLTSCSREPNLTPSQKYYLAGAIDRDGIFRGPWQLN